MTRAALTLRPAFETPPREGEAMEVASGILWMRLPLPMALDHVNVYALDDGDGWTIVDTGMDSRRTRAIWQGLLDGPLAGRPVTRVIVTHHHPDHIGLAGWFQAQGATLLTTRTAWLMARMLVLDERPLPGPEQMAFWRAAGMEADLLAARLLERPFNFADCVAPLPLGYTRIAQGDVLTIGARRWQVHIGHGHAPEHAVLFSLDEPLVLGGISCCLRSRPISGSMRRNPPPIRWGNGSSPARRSSSWPGTTSLCCRATSCPMPACRCG